MAVYPGTTIHFTVGFKNLANEPADPDAVTMELYEPGAVDARVFTYPLTISKTSIGNYYTDVELTIVGQNRYRWEGVGTVDASTEGVVIVEPLPATPADQLCVDILRALYDAIIGLGAGKAVVRVRFSEREVQYSQGSLKDMLAIYRAHYAMCGLDSGLPPLDESSIVMRGRPLTVWGAGEDDTGGGYS